MQQNVDPVDKIRDLEKWMLPFQRKTGDYISKVPKELESDTDRYLLWCRTPEKAFLFTPCPLFLQRQHADGNEDPRGEKTPGP